MKAKYAGIDYLVSGCLNSHLAFCLHADGQKIAKKLCKGISRETTKVKHLLQEYNAVSSQMDSSFLSLSLEEILSPTCSIWQSPAYEQSSQVSFNTKRDIIVTEEKK